jgi:hypothetical protein
MVPATTKKSLVFIILGACLVALAIALNVSWIVINWRAGLLLVLGSTTPSSTRSPTS